MRTGNELKLGRIGEGLGELGMRPGLVHHHHHHHVVVVVVVYHHSRNPADSPDRSWRLARAVVQR